MTQHWQPRASRETLVKRASLLRLIRQHFAAHALEIDVPICQGGPNRDHGVDVSSLKGLDKWVITSPEHPLKRLVAAGYGAVWSLTPCVRIGESGRLHRPEFHMLEWYRPGLSLDELLAECLALLTKLLDRELVPEVLSWSEAMQRVLPTAPDQCSLADLRNVAPELPASCGRDDCLDYIFGALVQPLLGQQGCTVVNRWPATACAQANIAVDEQGATYAARFELFVQGVELANAYDECWNADEIRQRFDQDAAERSSDINRHDEAYLSSLEQNPGQVSGVAMGFDRILMLACGLSDVGDTMAFPWEIA